MAEGWEHITYKERPRDLGLCSLMKQELRDRNCTSCNTRYSNQILGKIWFHKRGQTLESGAWTNCGLFVLGDIRHWTKQTDLAVPALSKKLEQ